MGLMAMDLKERWVCLLLLTLKVSFGANPTVILFQVLNLLPHVPALTSSRVCYNSLSSLGCLDRNYQVLHNFTGKAEDMFDLVPCVQSSVTFWMPCHSCTVPTMYRGTLNATIVLDIVTSIQMAGNYIQYFIASVSAGFLLRKLSNSVCDTLLQGCLQLLNEAFVLQSLF